MSGRFSPGGGGVTVHAPLRNYGTAARADLAVDAASASAAGSMSAADYTLLHSLQAPVSRLAYTAAADLATGAAIAAGNYLTVVPAQNFTVSSTASVLLLTVRLGCEVSGAAACAAVLYANVDGTRKALDRDTYAGGAYGGLGSGSWWLGGLAAGAHTVKVEVYASANATANCRPASQPATEFAGIDIVELNP